MILLLLTQNLPYLQASNLQVWFQMYELQQDLL